MDGELGPHGRLPAERELARRFGISRLTVRRVLDRLEAEGEIYRERGSGTFVSERRLTKSLELTSFTEDMAARGMTPGSRLLEARARPAGTDVGGMLQVSPREEVVHIRRVRLADGLPICLEDAFLPSALFPGILDSPPAGSLYEHLRARYDVRMAWADQTINATVLDPDQAALLEAPEFAPAFDVSRLAFDTRGRRSEYTRSIYRGDRYAYTLTVRRNRPAQEAGREDS
jgi:GntR family transcriptional regulator